MFRAVSYNKSFILLTIIQHFLSYHILVNYCKINALSGRQLQAGGFLYDSSLVTPPTSSKAPYWPYTMDFGMPHACNSPPCPQRGYRGLWELALNPIFGLFGESCYEADRCTFGSTGIQNFRKQIKNIFSASARAHN